MKKEENFELTESQKVLKDKLTVFLKSSDRIFRIIGKPGVGKTTMTKICLSEFINADIESHSSGSDINVAGIALAHQAKNVLGEHIPNVFTFAKAYGMKEVIHKDGSRTFDYDPYAEEAPIGEAAVPVFVHDEVSQYTPEMLKIVLEKTSMFSKIIFMGDKAQLPPIDPDNKMGRDADSPVFDIELTEECQHELTERVRQSQDNPILDLSDAIREEIFGKQDIYKILKIIEKPNMINGCGYGHMPYRELNNHLKEKNQISRRIIAFRNKTIEYYNFDIRNFLLNKPEKIIIENDIICMTDNFYHETKDGYIDYKLYNSDTFKLGRIEKRKINFSDGMKTHRVEVYVAKIVDEFKKEFIIPTEEGEVQYEKALEIMSEKCKAHKMKWETFWNFKKKFCSATYGYAVTAYKSQGSTYDTVYVDINDILLTKPLTPKRKLQTIYTAITRAKFDVWFLKASRYVPDK